MTTIRTRTFAAIIVSTAVSAATMAYPTSAPATPAGGCPAVVAEFMAGTWETNPAADPTVPVGVLKSVADPIAAATNRQVTIRFPGYEARAFDNSDTYAGSKATGVTALTRDLAEQLAGCPQTKVTIAGFSQGADAAGDVAAAIGAGRGPVTPDRVLGVALLADPHRGTQGAQDISNNPVATGIAGPRSAGFGSLSGRVVQLCLGGDQPDLYCATDTSKTPIIAALGKTLSGSTPSGPGTPGLSEALVSDYSGANVEDLATNLATIEDQTHEATPSSPTTLSSAATAVANTLLPLVDTATWSRNNPAVATQLSNASPGSPESAAKNVLDTVSNMDLTGAVNNAISLANSAQALLTGGNVPAGSLTGTGQQLQSQTAPLTATPLDLLSTGTSALSLLKPSVLVGQVVNAATNGVSFAENLPKIIAAFGQLGGLVLEPNLDIAGKIHRAHGIVQDLNNLFSPIIDLAAGVDLHLASSLLSALAPLDPSPTTSIASLVVGLIGNLDIKRLADDIGGLQEALWKILDGGDWLGAGLKVLTTVPDLIAVAVGTLSGEAKTSSGTPRSSTATPTTLRDAATSLVSTAGTQGADQLSKLASEGLTAVSFFASHTHDQGYNTRAINSAGDTAAAYATKFLLGKIQPVLG